MFTNVEKLVGSITAEDFVTGLLNANRTGTLGDIWEKFVDCDRCAFAKQCNAICSHFAEHDRLAACSDVVNILLGDAKLE